jgi:hypothetical protein
MRIVPRDTVVGFLLGIFLVVLAPPPAALAHDPFVWFDPIGWDNHQDINYKIDDSIPGDDGSNFEMRIHDATAEWNVITGAGGFHYDDIGNGNHSWQPPCNWQNDTTDLWFFSHDIGFPGAVTNNCEIYHPQQQYTDVQASRVAFDNGGHINWYVGTGNVPANQAWVQEAALHEEGHVTGVYRGATNAASHWPAAPSNMCAEGGAESDFTMCPMAYLGVAFQEPLDAHDIDTFQNFY